MNLASARFRAMKKVVLMLEDTDRHKCPRCIATLGFSCLVLFPSCCSAQLYKPALWFANINSVFFSHLRDNQWEMEKGVPRPRRLPPTVIYWFYTKSDWLVNLQDLMWNYSSIGVLLNPSIQSLPTVCKTLLKHQFVGSPHLVVHVYLDIVFKKSVQQICSIYLNLPNIKCK